MGHPSPQNRLDLRQLIGAPVVLVTRRSATTSQARCGYTPVSHMTGRRVRMLPWDPLWRLRHVGYPVSPRGYRGLPAFASLSMAGSDGNGPCPVRPLALKTKTRYPTGAMTCISNSSSPSSNKRVFDLVKDFGTSESPKSTRSSTTHWCPGRPGHPAFRHNIASSLRLHTGLPYDWTPRSDAPLGSPLAPSARRVSRVASRLPGTTRLRFALHGGQRANARRSWCGR